MRLAAGIVLAERYRLTALLGQGGMGEVWAARHVLTGKAVAVKRLVYPADERGQREARARFALEARSACAVDHPNVVEVFDFIESATHAPLIVMELLRGETLAARLARGPLGGARAVAALMQPVVSAVGTAHERGIVHRDLKPSNIFIDERPGEPRPLIKVLDFGIAKWLHAGCDDVGLRTRTGSTLGTPSYMAPEQATGDRSADHRVDVWSLGVILYEALSGVRPLEGDNAAQLVMRLLSTGIMPIEHLVPELPAELAALIGRMLARDVARRPADLREVQGVLAALSGEASLGFGLPRTGDGVTPDRVTAAAPAPFAERSSSVRLAPAGAAPVPAWPGTLRSPLAQLASGNAHAAVLETHTALEMNTLSPSRGNPVAQRAQRPPRVALAALVGLAALLASTALWFARERQRAEPDTQASAARVSEAPEPSAAARPIAPIALAANVASATAPREAAASRAGGDREPEPAAARQAASPRASASPRLTLAHTARHERRTRTTAAGLAASSRPGPAALASTGKARAATVSRTTAPSQRAEAAAALPLRASATGRASGAECDSSAECESRICVAYACQ